MTEEHIRLAAANNAAWCDAVCRAHGRPGEIRDGLWRHAGPPLPFYPNAVTLDRAPVESQMAAIRELAGSLGELLGRSGAAGWGVKDSFCALDLAPLGFEVLFTATWIWRPADLPVAPAGPPDVTWRRVAVPAELAAWETAWSGAPADGGPLQGRTFLPSLLADRQIAFLGGYRAGKLAGGVIANLTGAVVGLSNLFAPDEECAAWWVGAVAAAIAAFPGLPLVGYEQAESLPWAAAAGFVPLGPLRVWLKAGDSA